MTVFPNIFATVVSDIRNPCKKEPPLGRNRARSPNSGDAKLYQKTRFDGTSDIRNSEMNVSFHSGVVGSSISGFWGESWKQIWKIFKNSNSLVWKSVKLATLEAASVSIQNFQFKFNLQAWISTGGNPPTWEWAREISVRCKIVCAGLYSGKGNVESFPGCVRVACEIKLKFGVTENF